MQWSKRVVATASAFLLLFTVFSVSSFSGSKDGENSTAEFPPVWSDDYQISNASTEEKSTDPSTSLQGNSVHIVWGTSRPKNPGPGSEIKLEYARSIDGGKSWPESIDLIPYDGHFRLSPEIVSDNQSSLHLIWDDSRFTRREVMYRNSTDNGETWNNEIILSPADSEYSQNPSIACSGQNVHVVWADERTGDFEVFYKMSKDGGIMWEDGQGNIGQDRRMTFWPGWTDGPDDIAVSGNHVHVLFTKITAGNVRRAYYLHSPDNGATWDPEVEISNDPLSAYTGGISAEGATVHIVWEGFKDGRALYYRNSTNNGTTWNPEIRLTYDPEPPKEQADIAVNASHVFVTWMDDRDHYDWTGSTSGAFELYYIESFDGGSTWGSETRLTYAVNNSIQPCVAMDADNIHIAWTDNRTNGSRQQIFYKRLPDFPDTTPPDHTNETPLPDSYKDAPGTNISIHITDPSGVNESTIQLYVNGSLVSHTSTPIIDGYNVSWISPGFDPGVIECRIVADDNCSNTLDYYWNFTVLALYEIQLQEGWNLISLPFEQINESIDSVLSSIDGKWDRIMAYDPLAQDKWESYNINKPASLNELSELNHEMGFWINVTEQNVNLTVRGNITSSTSISLYAGWNLIGYPTQNTETVGNALWGTGADRVEVFNATEPYLIKEVEATYVMKPGEGYWVHAPADTVWVVDW